MFFFNAPASAAAPASPTELSDDGGGSAATQTTHRNAPPYHNIIPRHNTPSTTPSKTAQSLKNNQKKRKSHSQDSTSAGWCSSPTLPPAQQLPQRPRSCLMMAEVQQPHKQHVTAHTLNHIRFRRQSQHDVFFALHSLERSKDVIAGSSRAMRPTASCTFLLITSLILAVFLSKGQC